MISYDEFCKWNNDLYKKHRYFLDTIVDSNNPDPKLDKYYDDFHEASDRYMRYRNYYEAKVSDMEDYIENEEYEKAHTLKIPLSALKKITYSYEKRAFQLENRLWFQVFLKNLDSELKDAFSEKYVRNKKSGRSF